MSTEAIVPRVVPTGAPAWHAFWRSSISIAGALMLGFVLIVSLAGSFWLPFDPEAVGSGAGMSPPGLPHLMGTDELGRDVLSRVMAGTRVTVFVGCTAALVSTFFGVLIGATSGFYGGWIDDGLMRVTEAFQVIPRFFLAMMLVAFFGASLWNVILAIALLSWPVLARIVRAELLTLRTRQFVDAARVIGVSTGTLVFQEILPNALGTIIVNATLLVGQAIIIEAGLSYIGLGDPNHVSLGLMLQQAQAIMRSAWWATTFPGAFIFLAVLGVNLVGDGLNDALNPRSRNR